MAWLVMVGFFLALVPSTVAAPQEYLTLGYGDAKHTDDLPGIRNRKLIRALVNNTQTNYFLIGGEENGFEYELLRKYEKHLNRGVSRRKRRIKIVFIPVPFDRLIPELLEGRGDIAAAGLTITEDRKKRVKFSTPYLPNVDEIVVAHKNAAPLKTIKDLSGKKVFVVHSSSYAQHLHQLNKSFWAERRWPVRIREANKYLQSEDLLEMANARIIDYMVVDNHIAEIWSQVYKNLVLYKEIKVNSGGKIAWAVRPNNPQLLKHVNGFLEKHGKGSLVGNVLFNRYFKNTKWVTNPISEPERKKFNAIVKLLKKYGDQYGFDWLMIGAQAYQESRLDQAKVSRRGAIGVMQMLPSTAADPNVAIRDIRKLENNIHAGVKYLNFLRKQYYSDPAINPEAQVHFAHAAYNSGPSRVRRMRSLASKMGLDPNKWFGNVETAALRLVGQEPVRYVVNIQKYYIAYKLVLEEKEKREAARGKY
jgi:membrane-bound lytic murein transglycosylase MltF